MGGREGERRGAGREVERERKTDTDALARARAERETTTRGSLPSSDLNICGQMVRAVSTHKNKGSFKAAKASDESFSASAKKLAVHSESTDLDHAAMQVHYLQVCAHVMSICMLIMYIYI